MRAVSEEQRALFNVFSGGSASEGAAEFDLDGEHLALNADARLGVNLQLTRAFNWRCVLWIRTLF